MSSATFVSLVVYVLTAAPSLSWAHWGSDGGDFVTAAVTGRVPHPPGFPLYWLLTRLSTRWLRGDPAGILNLFSAGMASLAVGLTVRALLDDSESAWGGAVTGFALAFAPLFWSQALITELYTSAAAFVALAMMLSAWEPAGAGSWRAPAAGLAWGLAAAVHPVALAAGFYLITRMWEHRARFVLGAVAALVLYGLLPLLSRPWPQPWGDLSSLRGWWAYVSARLYRHYLFGLPLRHWPRRSLAWIVTLVRQVTPVGGALWVLGGRSWLRDRRRRLIGLGISLGLVGLYSIGYNTDDSLVYLVPLMPLLVLPLARGVAALRELRIPQGIGIIVPVILLIVGWPVLDLSGDGEAVDWTMETLAALPRDAVVVTEDDAHTFALWYGTEVRDVRADVLIVDRRLWRYEMYRGFLASRVGSDDHDQIVELAQGRPICEVNATEVRCP